MLARTPRPPYYAVVFASLRAEGEGDDAYARTADAMTALAATQPGFLGVDSVRDARGVGITVSYWQTEEDIVAWRAHAAHALARQEGRARFYLRYELRVARVERAYGFDRDHDPPDDPATRAPR